MKPRIGLVHGVSWLDEEELESRLRRRRRGICAEAELRIAAALASRQVHVDMVGRVGGRGVGAALPAQA